MATWRSGYAAACKAVYTGSIPVVALGTPCKWLPFGRASAQTSVYPPRDLPNARLGVVGREIDQGVRGHQSSDASTSDYQPDHDRVAVDRASHL
jgi:hypothetical protein